MIIVNKFKGRFGNQLFFYMVISNTFNEYRFKRIIINGKELSLRYKKRE